MFDWKVVRVEVKRKITVNNNNKTVRISKTHKITGHCFKVKQHKIVLYLF